MEMQNSLLAQRFVDSPVGPLFLVADRHAVRALRFADPQEPRPPVSALPSLAPRAALRLIDRLERELRDYFAGQRRDFTVPLAARGTPFQERVWGALRAIPYGSTATYGDIARAIGMPAAARAIGGANNQNPIAIVIPCHRVIGADAKLVGYASGLAKKVALLQLEGALPAKGRERAVAAAARHG